MIRIAFLDDHPAVRAGLEVIVAPHPDLVSVGVAADALELDRLLRRTRPDVVVLDVDHPGEDGLQLALRLTAQPPAPRIVVHSSRPQAGMRVAAALAGADAIVSKSDGELVLLTAIREAATGSPGPLTVSPASMTRAASRLQATDRAILAMLLAPTSLADVATTLGTSVPEVRAHRASLVERLARPPEVQPADEGAAPVLARLGLRRAAARSPRAGAGSRPPAARSRDTASADSPAATDTRRQTRSVALALRGLRHADGRP